MKERVESLVNNLNQAIATLLESMKSKREAVRIIRRSTRYNNIEQLANFLKNSFIPSVKTYVQGSGINLNTKNALIQNLDQLSRSINNNLIGFIRMYFIG